jgi:addiction module RelE/StbE family toxin
MRVAWTRIALSQLDEIQDYIAEESPASAYRLVEDIISRTERLLADNPNAGRMGRVRGTRELVFSDVRYIVVYRVTRRVEIVAVIHGARDWPESF